MRITITAYFRPVLSMSCVSTPTLARTTTTTGSSNSSPAPNDHVSSIEKYFEMSNSLTIASEIWNWAKNCSAIGAMTR